MSALRSIAVVWIATLLVSGCDVLGVGGVGPGSPLHLPKAVLGTPGEVVEIRGRVLENQNMMPVDGLGFLRIAVSGEEVEVIYGYGEWPPCPNDRGVQQGIAARVGQQVEVYGVIVEGGEITTCESEAYYIRAL